MIESMTGFNPLLCSPSPRDIPEVIAAHIALKEDLLYAKYFTERLAYKNLRDYFLEHKEYTHMVLCPDDLIVKPEDLAMLREDVLQYDYPVISGICNVDLDGNKNNYAITLNIPHPVRPLLPKEGERRWGWRWYAWYNDDLIKMEQKIQNREIIRVWHAGFALQAIRRDVVEQIEFATDAVSNGLEKWECAGTDVMFSNSCAVMGVPIYADPRIKMLHLRRSGPIEITLGEGYMKFYPKKRGPEARWEDYETIPNP